MQKIQEDDYNIMLYPANGAVKIVLRFGVDKKLSFENIKTDFATCLGRNYAF